jgi:hypothetical protein
VDQFIGKNGYYFRPGVIEPAPGKVFYITVQFPGVTHRVTTLSLMLKFPGIKNVNLCRQAPRIVRAEPPERLTFDMPPGGGFLPKVITA